MREDKNEKLVPRTFETMRAKYTQPDCEKAVREKQTRPWIPTRETLNRYWMGSIYKHDWDALMILEQCRGETTSDRDALLLTQTIQLNRTMREFITVLKDGFKDIRKMLEEGRKDKENDG